LAAALAGSILVFDKRTGIYVADHVLAFVLFPFVIWAAIRFAVAGTALVSAAIAAVAVYETSLGFGPFVQADPVRGAILLQVFLAVISISGMALAAAIAEREQAEGALQLVRDLVVQREQAEAARRSSEQRMGAIVDSAMDAIITVDEAQRVIVFNAAAERIFGCPAAEAMGSSLDRFIPTRFRDVHRRHIHNFGETGTTARSMYSPGTLYGVRATGQEFPIEATISQVEAAGQKLYTVILRDITLRKQSEEALVKSEKLASAGRLAATIAHEINNPLAAVTNLLFLAKNQFSLPDNVRHYLDTADLELSRVAHITKQTLGFYREEGAPTKFRPAEILDSVVELLKRKIQEKHVEVEKSYRSDAEVFGAAGEIRQVFSNLVSNSVEAVGKGGKVTLRVGRSRHWQAWQPLGVRVTIADTGHGISPENLAHIFEPFFTTKKDAGTGLGLWVSKQIIERHGGCIGVRSSTHNSRRGTVFSIFLPFEAAQQPDSKAPDAGDGNGFAMGRAV
jgi:PAS domain S-box-containing protein